MIIRLLKWLWLAWPAILLAFAVVGPVLVAPYSFDSFLIVVGGAYQLFGVFLVLQGIDSRLDLFQGKGLPGSIRKWLSECPLWRKPRVISLSGQSGGITMTGGTARLTKSLEGLTIDEKIETLAKEMESLWRYSNESVATLRAEVKKLVEAQVEKNTEVQVKLSEIENRLSFAFTGNLKWEVVGAGLIISGILFSTIASMLIQK